MGFGHIKKGMQLNNFEQQIEQMAKLYPGRHPLIELQDKRIGRVIDFHKAPVPGYYKKDKDLVSIEILAKIPDGKEFKYAPTDPAQIIRTRIDDFKLIGVI